MMSPSEEVPKTSEEEALSLTGEDNRLNDETASVGSLDSLLDDEEDIDNEIKKKKKCKRGVVYLSYIPPSMNPTILRRLLSEYATIERLYLQPDLKKGKKKLKRGNLKNVKFSEGWVEFLKKRDAKHVAATLNNTQIGGKKKSKFREYLWNLKYLPRFKWIHLCERLNYERAVRQQRLRVEVSQAKKVANHFAETVDREEKQKRRKGPKPPAPPPQLLTKRFPQKGASEDLEVKKKKEVQRDDFLKSLFG